MLEDLDPLMEAAGVDAIVTEGNAFTTPDIYWLTGFRSPDQVIYFKARGDFGTVAAGFNALDRIRKESFVTHTYDLTDLYTDLMRQNKRAEDSPDLVYGDIFRKLFTGKVVGVPDHIPARVLVAIQQMGYVVKVVPNLLKDARATKSGAEVKAIKRAGDATIESVSQAIQMIGEAKIGPNKNLLHHGKALTVNDIKLALERAQLERNAESAEDTIVAVGRKAFDWHYLGVPRDVLKAGEPIIIDVYPRLKLDRYVADVTRTVVKGSLSGEVQLMYDSVMEASDAAIDALRDGALIDDVNMACYHSLKAHGFDSRRLNPSATEGMTHGLGHGIGLEVHENPSMYRYKNRFSEGHVMAIEPGVYLKSIGGVRVENDYAVTKGKAKRLTPGLDDVISL